MEVVKYNMQTKVLMDKWLVKCPRPEKTVEIEEENNLSIPQRYIYSSFSNEYLRLYPIRFQTAKLNGKKNTTSILEGR